MIIKILKKLDDKIQLNLFKLANKMFFKEVDDEICNCLQMNILYEHFDNKICAITTSKELIESNVGLVLIPILDMDYYKYLKDKDDLFISANSKMPIHYGCASVHEVRDNNACVFVINRKSVKNIPGKFTELKSFCNLGQIVALVGLSLSVLKFNIKFENTNILNNFLCLIVYLAFLTPIFLFQNDFIWYASRYCPSPKKLILFGFSLTLTLSTIFMILLYILNLFL